MTERELEFALQWLLDDALHNGKLPSKRKYAYASVSPASINEHASLIGSHIAYKAKDDDGILKMKLRLVPDKKPDIDRFLARSDSTSVDFSIK